MTPSCPQLATGRVEVGIEELKQGVVERFRPAFARVRPGLRLVVPLSEVFKSLPASAIPAAQTEHVPISTSPFQTPFAIKADEDRGRMALPVLPPRVATSPVPLPSAASSFPVSAIPGGTLGGLPPLTRPSMPSSLAAKPVPASAPETQAPVPVKLPSLSPPPRTSAAPGRPSPFCALLFPVAGKARLQSRRLACPRCSRRRGTMTWENLSRRGPCGRSLRPLLSKSASRLLPRRPPAEVPGPPFSLSSLKAEPPAPAPKVASPSPSPADVPGPSFPIGSLKAEPPASPPKVTSPAPATPSPAEAPGSPFRIGALKTEPPVSAPKEAPPPSAAPAPRTLFLAHRSPPVPLKPTSGCSPENPRTSQFPKNYLRSQCHKNNAPPPQSRKPCNRTPSRPSLRPPQKPAASKRVAGPVVEFNVNGYEDFNLLALRALFMTDNDLTLQESWTVAPRFPGFGPPSPSPRRE